MGVMMGVNIEAIRAKIAEMKVRIATDPTFGRKKKAKSKKDPALVQAEKDFFKLWQSGEIEESEKELESQSSKKQMLLFDPVVKPPEILPCNICIRNPRSTRIRALSCHCTNKDEPDHHHHKWDIPSSIVETVVTPKEEMSLGVKKDLYTEFMKRAARCDKHQRVGCEDCWDEKEEEEEM